MTWLDGVPAAVGQRVRCQRDKPKRATWAKYDGKTGVITQMNEEAQEVCVSGRWGGEAWFRMDEVVRLSEGAK